MPSTRRRFLAGVTALTGGLAGCNESTSRAVRQTVTPVEVPRTDREILREVTAIETPSIRSGVVVSDAHLESAIDQLDRLRGSLIEEAESRDEPVHVGGGIDRGGTPEEMDEYVQERIRRAREIGPSKEALETLRGALHDVARAVGYLRAESGDLTVADVEDALEDERTAVRAIRDDLDYRVAAPVADNLPTVQAAEQTLQRLGGDERWEVQPARGDDVEHDAEATSEPRPTPTPEPDPAHVASRYDRLERVRRQRDDVEQYLETATDDGAPSVRAALEAELADVRAELEPVADEYHTEEGRSGGDSLVEMLRGMRRGSGRGTDRFLSRNPADPPDGDLVRVLFEGVEQLVSFRSIDVGVELTLERLDGRRFPTETLLAEKRRAAENLEHAAEQPALHRSFTHTAARVLRSADGYRREEAATVEEVARTHAVYVAAAEWADRGVARGEATSASLQAQQS